MLLLLYGLYTPRHVRHMAGPAAPVLVPVPAEAEGVHLVSVPTSSNQPMAFVAVTAEQDPEMEIEPEGHEEDSSETVAVRKPPYGSSLSPQSFEIEMEGGEQLATDWSAEGLPIGPSSAAPQGTEIVPAVASSCSNRSTVHDVRSRIRWDRGNGRRCCRPEHRSYLH